MTQDLSLRLSICLNDCPIGPRIQRLEPLPPYRHTYSLAEQAVAEADRNMGMRGITNPETDSGYVGISLTGSTQGKKTVLAALW